MPKLERVLVRLAALPDGRIPTKEITGDLEIIFTDAGEIVINDYAQPRESGSAVVFAAARGAWTEAMSLPATKPSEDEK